MICWALKNIMGTLLMNCWRSTSLSTFSLSVFDIALLYKSVGLMFVDSGISSCIIWVGDRGGGVETKSIASNSRSFVIFIFLSLSFFSSSSTKPLNCSLTETLFLAASIKILVALACNSSSSSEIS